jgi:multidrug efflux pump subunit AcrB
VIIDMPEGTTLERTSAVTKEIAQYLSTKPQVVNYQNYIGTSAPITFNRYVIMIYLRSGSKYIQCKFIAQVENYKTTIS